MKKEILMEVATQIALDIINGVYDNFPKLKDRLGYISRKIRNQSHIVNGQGLTKGELATLRENEYIYDNRRVL